MERSERRRERKSRSQQQALTESSDVADGATSTLSGSKSGRSRQPAEPASDAQLVAMIPGVTPTADLEHQVVLRHSQLRASCDYSNLCGRCSLPKAYVISASITLALLVVLNLERSYALLRCAPLNRCFARKNLGVCQVEELQSRLAVMTARAL